MRVLNQHNQPITEYDLTNGRLAKGKFKHKDGTVEDVMMYIPNRTTPNRTIPKSVQIRKLKEKLSATDYKVIKCAECQLLGLDMPYDVDALHAERQAIRDEINRLEESK